MNTTKIVASAALVMMLLPVGTAMAASTPRSPSFQQTQCAADGGSFSVGGAGTYLCHLPDGSTQTCTFSGAPACTIADGPVDHGYQKGHPIW